MLTINPFAPQSQGGLRHDPQMARDDAGWMSLAVDLAKLCPLSEGAYSVGAVIVDEHGQEMERACLTLDT